MLDSCWLIPVVTDTSVSLMSKYSNEFNHNWALDAASQITRPAQVTSLGKLAARQDAA